MSSINQIHPGSEDKAILTPPFSPISSGPRGYQGPLGPQGITGTADGPAGPRGPQGITGITGDHGLSVRYPVFFSETAYGTSPPNTWATSDTFNPGQFVNLIQHNSTNPSQYAPYLPVNVTYQTISDAVILPAYNYVINQSVTGVSGNNRVTVSDGYHLGGLTVGKDGYRIDLNGTVSDADLGINANVNSGFYVYGKKDGSYSYQASTTDDNIMIGSVFQNDSSPFIIMS